MAKIMIQGTASSVGKSILVSALCRIFKQDGYKVVPYKSQNMSLNSYITLDGKEMGRAQVLQAYACGMEPQVYMNPILLKPTSDKKSQVIVNGKVYGNYTAMEYHNMKPIFKDMLKQQFEELEKEFDVIVIEGAGSPAEINLRERDIVNMGLAELVDAPVILAGDIDKGGVFASLAGTMLLLKDDEKKRVKGTVINKFRGDIDILKPGLDMLEDIMKIPCMGVVPYFNLQLEDEDGAVEFEKKAHGAIDIAVIKLPHISNFTDLDALKAEEDVSIRFITNAEEFGNPDLVIIPGSKNTIEDLLRLRESGVEKKIKEFSKDGMVIGICGGYQMLGNSIEDPYGVETNILNTEGMKLLDIDTTFEEEKVTTRVKAIIASDDLSMYVDNYIVNYNDVNEKKDYEENSNINKSVYGYEIHMGICKYGVNSKPLFNIVDKNRMDVDYSDGAINKKGNVMGTYIHGIFDSIYFREYIVNLLRSKKGISLKKSKEYEKLREKELDKLAQIVRNALDMESIYKIMGLNK
ncbi:cobyric acid synthase [Clostridium sp.]|jgi:adenosylcobyric acid synthase|uniref:cobyric acid synthase n=1 Tax=Clostridium sp. TaxID=1506 RepID=UPI00258D589C|nr:cobyric acid synthase [Clostridium sp.]MDF2504064.1 cobyric acid synthase CobQ [Clostridium sp.]